jgi:hypothetical protein
MSSNNKMLPPFRDSNLTRLLKSMFLENGKAVILITLDPSAKCLEESMNSVRFAKFARKVKTSVIKKDPSNLIDERSLPVTIGTVKSVVSLKQEIDSLKHKLKQKQLGCIRSGPPDPIRFNAQLMRENERLRLLCDDRKINEIVHENSLLKKKLEQLMHSDRQAREQSSGGQLKSEEVDSTGSGFDLSPKYCIVI